MKKLSRIAWIAILAGTPMTGFGQLTVNFSSYPRDTFGFAEAVNSNDRQMAPVPPAAFLGESPSRYVTLHRTTLNRAAEALDALAAPILNIALGNVTLQPNQAGQVVDFYVQNTGTAALNNIFGINLAFQVGDGTSGPQIQAVSLSAGNSIFAADSVNQVDQGSNSHIQFQGIDGGGVALSLPAGSSSLLAEVTFDTTGLNAGSGPWAIHADQVGPIDSATKYVLIGGGTRSIDSFVDGTISVVPEPAESGIAAGIVLLLATTLRRSYFNVR